MDSGKVREDNVHPVREEGATGAVAAVAAWAVAAWGAATHFGNSRFGIA